METHSTKKLDALMVNVPTTMEVPSSFVSGRAIGSYKGATIFDQITDNFGVVRHFDGVTTQAKCGPGGIIAKPGIVYEIR